jgi:hypothetical protein
MQVINCTQGSHEWHEARRGPIATASRFGGICTPKTGKMGAAARTYAIELLVAELVPPHYWTKPDFQSQAMMNGTNTEREARKYFSFDTGLEVDEVGFIKTDCGRFGCSPDGLIGGDSGLELKCPLHTTQVRYLLDGKLPSEYAAQVHGSMLVTKRSSWWFMSYAPGLPPLILEVKPDSYTEALSEALEEFWAMLQEMRAKLQPADPVAAVREIVQPYF